MSDALGPQVHLLIGAALETWAHHLLYVRRVYPQSTFSPVRFQGVQCYVNRHPSVVQYIHDTVELAIPSLVDGAAEDICLSITCDEQVSQDSFEDPAETSKVMEESVLRFPFLKDFISSGSRGDLEGLERALRDVVLQLNALESMTCPFAKDSTTSFRLEFRLRDSFDGKLPQEVLVAFMNGSAHRADQSSFNSAKQGFVVRPLLSKDLGSGRLQLFHRRGAVGPSSK